MKFFHTLLLTVAVTVVAPSCAPLYQVVYLSPTTAAVTKNDDNVYEYKDNDVIVRYSFWGNKGVMGFIIYNNTEKPMYIDWKKSSFIVNERQFPYYEDKVTSNFRSVGSSYGTTWLSIFNRYNTSSVSASRTQGTVVKEEQVSFIAPHTYIAKAQYNLIDFNFFQYDKKNTKKDSLNGKYVYVTQLKKDIVFRNYITYSSTDKFENEKHIDNEFKIKKILTMGHDDYYREYKHVVVCDWIMPTRFYMPKVKKATYFKQHNVKH